jgi:hypothetical protein
MVNFNNDAYSDFFLFNSDMNQILSVKGSFQGEFVESKKYSVPSRIFSIQPMSSRPSSRYVFTNRKERKVGLYKLNDEGKPELERSIDFESYPEFINTADVDGSGRNEILISGGAFDGISLLYQKGDKLFQNKIAKGTFSQAAFIDLSNDGFADIAAYNLMNRSFDFYYNNSEGEFEKVRSISLLEKPAIIKTFDINLDSNEDLIFTSGKSIYIWYGDFRSSYENTKKIETHYKPDKFIYGDFNKDGRIDIAYLNFEQSLISVLFAKDEFGFYPEIIYLHQNNLKDISPYYSRFVNGIAALSSDGKLYTITNLSLFSEIVNISLGAKPGALSYFDNKNNGITDFCFIDEYDKKIKFITRNNDGIPASYFSFQLHENHSRIISENLKADEKNYLCFSYSKKLIEVVKANFSRNRITKEVLYSPGPILDLKIKRKNDDEYKIYILYSNNGFLDFGVFNFRNNSFSFSKQVIERGNPYDASLGLEGSLNINYWAEKNREVKLFNGSLTAITVIPKEKFSFEKNDSINIVSFTGDLLNKEEDVSFNFINVSEKDYAVISADAFISVINKKERSGEFRITSKNNLFFGETRFNGLKKLCVYLPEEQTVNRLEFIQRGKNVVSTKLAGTLQLTSFFIKNMTSKNYHLVYTDNNNNCITIKRLKE